MATRAKPNVLVVDDDPVTILAVKAVLSSLDVNVVEASNGEDVIRQVLGDDFAVILMDVQMPGMDGFATAAVIRERGQSRHIPIIFCTGTYTDEPTAFQGYAAGAVDYLFKPVVPAVLRSKVAVFVELYKQRERLQQQADLLAAKTEELVRSNLALHAEIAARQQAEAEVRLINRELEKRVEERTAQLLRAQRLETIGVLAGGIAHDLNNVLTPLTMGLPFLERRILHPADRSLLEGMKSSVGHAADMVRQILTFARGAEGDHRPVNLASLIGELVKLARHSFPKSIEIQTQTEPSLPRVMGDATQLYQVLMNLAVNACDAMGSGGTLSIAAESFLVDEHFAGMQPGATPGSYVVVRVRDTGTGIAPEIFEKIFDPFFTTKQPGHGTGLGLPTSMGIVRRHGGFMTVANAPTHGSEFAVYLPVAERAEVAPPSKKAVPDGSGELVLVVDDEAFIREVTKATLETHGYRVLTAADGAEAIAALGQPGADVRAAVVDMVMPVMDGPATVSALQKHNPAIAVIAVSGSAAAENMAHQLAGIRAFLRKPFTSDALLTTLAQVVHRTVEEYA